MTTFKLFTLSIQFSLKYLADGDGIVTFLIGRRIGMQVGVYSD